MAETPDEPILEVDDLHVSFVTEGGVVEAVRGVSFDLRPGEVLGIVGESGCGKSVTAMSLTGLDKTNPNARFAGSVRFRGRELLTLGERELRRVRGAEIAMVFQDPMTSLNPVHRVGEPDRRDAARPPEDLARRRRRARGRAAARGRHPRARATRERLPPPVLGRHAAARDDRDGARVRARRADRRRADDGARRDDPGADPAADRAHARVARRRGRADHARPRASSRDWPTASP